jgi:hypothetical protein
MKENSKIAWTTLEEIIQSFGCNIQEAINNSASLLKVLENQKINRCTLS